MSFFLWIFFVVVGFLATTFVLFQSFISLFFAIPFTNYLDGAGFVLKRVNIMKRIGVTVVFSLVKFTFVVLLMYFFFATYLSAFLGGVLFSFLIGFKELGRNQGNIDDYYRINGYFLDMDGINQVIERQQEEKNENSSM